ncbi:hypothetical protein A3K73_09390 [Candidatus Pacearchaeota archaeon RBG_13_36_9]|nr:MAG: hypothetical protein A3K73_09390 [Candidatus Pacearchaeota archaeon RBG_13_36_9]
MEGKAYGFFKCNAPEAEIRDLIPKRPTRRGVIKSRLEVFTIQEMARRQLDQELAWEVRDAEDHGINYVLEGSREGVSNLEVAKDVKTALIALYQSPLYKPERKEPFCGLMLYEENGKYLERN